MAIEVQIDALLLTEWGGALRPTGDGWQAAVYCILTPYSGGQPVIGSELEQLRLLGLAPRQQDNIPYAGAEAPATTQVGSDMLQWVGATHAAMAAQWVGKGWRTNEFALPQA